LLNQYHRSLPRDARTLLGTPSSTSFKQLENGKFHYFGLATNLKQIISQNRNFKFQKFEISFNIDGIPLFRSSNTQFWPILGLLKNSCLISSPFLNGFFSGTSKSSPLHLFLNDFVEGLSNLCNMGLVYEGKTYDVSIHSIVCDAPARAFIKCTKVHSGYSACDRCYESGNYVKGRVVLPNLNSLKRSNDNFRLRNDEDHHTGLLYLI